VQAVPEGRAVHSRQEAQAVLEVWGAQAVPAVPVALSARSNLPEHSPRQIHLCFPSQPLRQNNPSKVIIGCCETEL